MTAEEERIALFLDYENLAIGARDNLGGLRFDLKPVTDALADRGRVVVRRAYADWSYFDDDRRMLARNHVELIEIPQRMGAARKNAADIKMAVDAIELCFERDYLTTFVICTGDSDFTPLVQKLRELNKRVIGVGVKASTSALLPAACDEFLFYERLEGVELPQRAERRRSARKPPQAAAPAVAAEEPAVAEAAADLDQVAALVTQTVAGMQRTGERVRASTVKRALLRKDPTFNEEDYGFRAFRELLTYLDERKVIELGNPKDSDPEVGLPTAGGPEQEAFALLVAVVAELESKSRPPALSGLKTQLRRRQPSFSERRLGYSGFLQFCKAAQTRGLVTLDWDEAAEDYVVRVAAAG